MNKKMGPMKIDDRHADVWSGVKHILEYFQRKDLSIVEVKSVLVVLLTEFTSSEVKKEHRKRFLKAISNEVLGVLKSIDAEESSGSIKEPSNGHNGSQEGS